MQSFFHGLDYAKGCRTDGDILERKGSDLVKFSPVGVWELSACFGPDIIDRTVIVGAKERTRQTLEDIILVLVNPEIGLDKTRRPHFEMSSQPLNISVSEQGARGLATICTLQAIGSGKFLLVQFDHHPIEVLWRLATKICKEPLVLLMFIFGSPRELTQFFLHGVKFRK